MRYRVPITFLFLLMLATVLYGENDNQPKWNATISGAILSTGVISLGFGGAVGYNLTPWVELEGEMSVIGTNGFAYRLCILSAGVILGKSNAKQRKVSPYLPGGAACTRGYDIRGFTSGMLGGGIKIRLKKELIRIDLRLYFSSWDIWQKLSFGWMWTF